MRAGTLARLRRQLEDERSGRVVFLSHCLLNQNTRYLGGAFQPGAVREAVDPFLRADVGISQMGCPERRAWGGVLKRRILAGYGARGRLVQGLRRVALPLFVRYTAWRYRRLARDVAMEVENYLRSGFEVVGLVGVGASPSCAVRTTLDLAGSLDAVASCPIARLDRDRLNRHAIAGCVRPGRGSSSTRWSASCAGEGLPYCSSSTTWPESLVPDPPGLPALPGSPASGQPESGVVPVSTQRLAGGRATRARVHYLDWLRVLAVLGVFLYHAGHPFDTTGWHVKNEDQTGALTVVMDFLGLWGLPLFFLIAGAGSVLAMRWRTPEQYLRERVQRLLVPLVVGYLLLSPVQSFIEETHFRRWSGSFPSFLPAFFGRVRDELLAAGFPPGPLVVGWPYHLWFLAFLLWFSLLGLPLLLWLRGPGGRRLSAGLGRVAKRRGAILLLALPMALLNVTVRGLPGEDHGWSELYYYFGFFLAGGVLLSDDRLARAVRRDLVPALWLGIAGLAVLLAGDAVGFFEAWDGRTYSWTYAWMVALFTVQAWGWVVSALSLGMRARSLDRPPPRTVSAAAMPFFLLHQPVILAIAFPVVRWDAGIPLKLAVVLLGSFAVSAALAVAVTRLRHVSALFGVKPVGQREPAGRRGDHRP